MLLSEWRSAAATHGKPLSAGAPKKRIKMFQIVLPMRKLGWAQKLGLTERGGGSANLYGIFS